MKALAMVASGLAVTVLLVLLLLLTGCDESKSDNADSVSGPGVDVHCQGLLPGQGQTPSGGVGDTSTKVQCSP
jgi:hypothetical protein